MKKLILILLLFPLFAMAQFSPSRSSYVSPGEYRISGLNTVTGQAVNTINITPQAYGGQPSEGVWFVQGGAHDGYVVGKTGKFYVAGSNEFGQDGLGNQTGVSNLTAALTDSLGNTLPATRMVLSTGNNGTNYLCTFILSTVATGGIVNGTGGLQNGMRGNGTYGGLTTSFVKVVMPGGANDTVTKIEGIYGILAITTKDSIITWGVNSFTPSYVHLPTGWKAYDIGCNGIAFWALASNGSGGHEIFSWSPIFSAEPVYQGQGKSGTSHSTPTRVDNNAFFSGGTNPMMNGTRYPTLVTCNNEATYFICNDHTLWDLGGNAVGEIGNGKETHFATYSTPYAWDQGLVGGSAQDSIYQDTAYNVAPGITDWDTVYTGFSNSWCVCAQRINGAIYMWGRNKGAQVWNGLIDCDYAAGVVRGVYPDFLNSVWPDSISWPGTSVTIQQTFCPYCIANPSGSPCNACTYNSAAAPTCSAGSNQSISTSSTRVTASATAASSYYINFYAWKQLSGPSTASIQFPGMAGTQINNLTTGTYTFQVNVIDNNQRTDSATMTVTVGTSTQTGFYVNSTTGSGTACSLAAPCPVSYIPTLVSTLTAGDTLYLARGGSYGRLNASFSGAAGNRIVIRPYGSGNEPIIGGMITLSPTGSGPVYTAACSGCTANTNLLTVDNALQSISTTPNAGAYYTFIPASSSTTTLYDPTDLASMPSIVGLYICVRSSPFTWDKVLVTGQTTTTLTVSPAVSYNNVGGNGWFILGTTPNANYEWSYSGGVGGTISIYMSGGYAGHIIQVPANDTVLYILGQHLEFDSLNIEGANIFLARTDFQTVGDIAFNGDSLQYGFDGISQRSTPDVTVRGGFIGHLGDNGITAMNNTASKDTVFNVTLFDIGMHPGMGGNGPGRYTGIIPIYNQPGTYAGLGDSTVVRKCLIDSVGYCGTYMSGNNSHADSNTIKYFCQILEDGAGNYWHDPAAVSYPNERTNNGDFVSHGGSAISHLGVSTDYSSAANGIYLDAFTQYVTVSGCTVDSVNSCSYYNHGPNNQFLYPTSLAPGFVDLMNNEFSGGPTITGVIVKHGTFSGNVSGAGNIYLFTANNDIASCCTIDSMYYNHTSNSTSFTKKDNTGAAVSMSFATWKTTYSSYDQHSSFQQLPFSLIGVPGNASRTVWLAGVYGTPSGTVYGSFVLPAYQSTLGYQLTTGTKMRIRNVSSMSHP